jgi:hypothetical protein
MARPKTTTEALLTEWGKWSRGGLGELGTTSAMAVAMRLVEPASCRIDPNISDEDALLVDRAVAQLIAHDKVMGEVVALTFVRGVGERELAMRLNISRDRAAKILAGAIGWVDCCINNFLQAA